MATTGRAMSEGEGPVTTHTVWEGPDEDMPVERETTHRRCLRIIHGNKGTGDGPSASDEPAMVLDGSGYAASLWTLPTFSCAAWETRP